MSTAPSGPSPHKRAAIEMRTPAGQGDARKRAEKLPRRACAVLLAAVALFAWGQQPGFSRSLSERAIEQLAAHFGAAARSRIAEWRSFARERAANPVATDAELLSAVNSFFNRLPFVSDSVHWQAEDYWATPAETVASRGADCEDFSISKYMMLKELGMPIGKLRITYVTSTRLKEPHMVLAYYATPEAEPMVLDNIDSTVRPASQRPDLRPVYSFNDDEVWLARRGSAGRAGSPLQIRKWRELQSRLEHEARP